MPYAKYRRFIQRNWNWTSFIARQLTDTGYITKATMEYLRYLFEKDHEVLGLKGQLTAELRYHWGLETILEELPDSPAWHEAESGKLRPGEKNRADHRHHAIDAVVIAPDESVAAAPAIGYREARRGESARRNSGRPLAEFSGERCPSDQEGKRVASRGTQGGRQASRRNLYGPTQRPANGSFASPWSICRRMKSSASAMRIRKIVVKAAEENGVEFGRGKKPDAKKMKEAPEHV